MQNLVYIIRTLVKSAGDNRVDGGVGQGLLALRIPEAAEAAVSRLILLSVAVRL